MTICCECGKPIKHRHYLDGKCYGYNCYRQALSIKYAKLTEIHNAVYAADCEAAISVFIGKKSSTFHDSICKQWKDCGKLTAKQLEAVRKCFTDTETLSYKHYLYDILSVIYDGENAENTDVFMTLKQCIDVSESILRKMIRDSKDEKQVMSICEKLSDSLDWIYPEGYYVMTEYLGKSATKWLHPIGFVICQKGVCVEMDRDFLDDDIEDECNIIYVHEGENLIGKTIDKAFRIQKGNYVIKKRR